MLSVNIEKQRKRAHIFQILFGVRMGGEPAGGGARLDKQKYFIGLFISTISNALV
jgi:hypothetical protein